MMGVLKKRAAVFIQVIYLIENSPHGLPPMIHRLVSCQIFRRLPFTLPIEGNDMI
jgi:hypothetical protein